MRPNRSIFTADWHWCIIPGTCTTAGRAGTGETGSVWGSLRRRGCRSRRGHCPSHCPLHQPFLSSFECLAPCLFLKHREISISYIFFIYAVLKTNEADSCCGFKVPAQNPFSQITYWWSQMNRPGTCSVEKWVQSPALKDCIQHSLYFPTVSTLTFSFAP